VVVQRKESNRLDDEAAPRFAVGRRSPTVVIGVMDWLFRAAYVQYGQKQDAHQNRHDEGGHRDVFKSCA
jgi:hypothetical protein